ncbi:MAG: pyruvate carboxylase subunit B [Anaerolineae bacterium]|nr:pyruvate carboxylase subunit B [Anaerolineae bacterium]
MTKNPLRICDTTLRDAHQSLLATRWRIEDMLPIAAEIDKVGYSSVEMWGGATFDSCMRFLGEDPWERLRRLKEAMPKTPFQMLLRGQNVVGYRHYADDVVERFIVKAHENGIDVLRVFDALNDLRNMEFSFQVIKREGAHLQACFSYTTSPVHTMQTFVDMAQRMQDMGADSICIKDMAGLATPPITFELVSRLKEAVEVPIQFHTHDTAGMGAGSCYAAAQAGVDVVDCSISSLSTGTGQPAVETIVGMLHGTDRDTELDMDQLIVIADYYKEAREKYAAFERGMHGPDVAVLRYQVPGGMLSNLVNQLREQNALDRYRDVTDEIQRVRADLGYPPLVTPSSQIVGTQATFNVLTGQRYGVIINEVKDYLRNMYGRPPGEVNEELRRQAIGDEKPIEVRPADLLEPEMEKAKDELGDLAESEEDVISYAIFGPVAREFLEIRKHGGMLATDPTVAAIAGLVAEREGMLETAPAEEGRPQLQLAVTPSSWRVAGRPRIRQIGGYPKW